VWIPNNSILRRAGVKDTAAARTYLHRIIGDGAALDLMEDVWGAA